MPERPMPDHLATLLGKPNPAVIATVRRDGRPFSVATWYLYEGGQILVNMDEGRRRLDHLHRDPRVSLTVLDVDGWHRHVSVRGTVTRMHEDAGLADIDRLSTHYTGKPYPRRDRGRVSAWVEIDGWHAWGF